MATGRILIAGAGIGGLTLGIALKQAGFEVQILERAEALAPGGAGLAMQINALAALRYLGLHERVIAAGCTIARARWTSWSGRLLVEPPIGVLAARHGLPMVALRRARLQELLLDAYGEGHLRLGAAVTGYVVTPGGVAARLESGETVEGDVLVGADGLHSVVREQLRGPEPLRYAGATSWRGLAPLVSGVAPCATTEAWGPGARFGWAPVGEGLVYWYAVVNAASGGADPTPLAPRLLARFGRWAGPVPDLIAATPPAAMVRTDLYDRPPSPAWSAGPVGLLGDAAHPMTPNLGQGACQAIEDAVVLARAFKRRGPTAEAWRAYEARRYARVRWFVERSAAVGALGRVEAPWAVAARDLALATTPRRTLMRTLERMADFRL